MNLVNEENEETTDVASITAITVTNGVDLVLHRPATGATGVVEVAVCASTNLIADTWFALTNVAFAASPPNLPRSFSAWEIVPSSFEFVRPAGLTTIVSRTFRIDRTSPWQKLFLVADASGHVWS